MYRIGILSSAHMHANSYVHQLTRHPGAELVGVFDDNPERAQQQSAAWGVPRLSSVDELLDICDAVVICSENVKHKALALAALDAGKPVLCEKPLATTPMDAKLMVDAGSAANVALFTAFPCRFSAAYRQLKAAVDAGELGEILAVRATNQGMCPGGWFVQKELSGGGAVMDHTVHVADLLRHLLADDVAEVYCESGDGLLHEGFDDSGVLTFTFEKGVFATLDASWSRPKAFPTWGNVTMGVVGTRGVIEMDMFAQESTLYSNRDLRVQKRNWGSDIDGGMVDAFVRALGGDTDAAKELASGLDGQRAVEIVDAAYRSASSHQPERVVRS